MAVDEQMLVNGFFVCPAGTGPDGLTEICTLHQREDNLVGRGVTGSGYPVDPR